MKKLLLYFTIFVLYTAIIISCPLITSWDRSFILHLQSLVKNLPLIIPMLPDCILYSVMIAIPILGLGIYFVKNKKWFDACFVALIPLITFLLNCVVKPFVHRARPPYELQLAIHPDSFSYVSSHSLVTFCLWAMVIFYANKLNFRGKNLITSIAVAWILFVGFSRIWLGVHYLSDVLGAYLLGSVLITFFIELKRQICKKF